MKSTKLLKAAALVAVAGFVMASSAKAALSLTMAQYGVGWSDPSAAPPPQADMLTYLNTMITLFNNHSDGYSTTITILNANDGGGVDKNQFTATVDKGSTILGSLSMVSSLSANNGVGGGPSGFTIDLGSGGFTYLIAGWDGPQGADQVYYVGGLTGLVTISNDELPAGFQKGLSNFWLSGDGTYTVVPEPSTVVAAALLLLPLGASAVRVLRRKQQV